MGADAQTPGGGLPDARTGAGSEGRRRDRPEPRRALRRQRLPTRARARRHPAQRAVVRGDRHAGCDDFGPALPPRIVVRRGGRRDRARARQTVRPAGRRDVFRRGDDLAEDGDAQVHCTRSNRQRRAQAEVTITGGTMATDPVCKMTVEPGRAAGTAAHESKTYYFCSAHCKSAFERDPAKYVDSGKPGHAGHAGHGKAGPAVTEISGRGLYTCPMHPEIRQPGPGSCPKCGMALEPETPSASAARTEYTCPMHPEVVREQPGNCPICGMALEPRTVGGAEEENAELRDMSRRFWVSTALAAPVFVMATVADVWPDLAGRFISARPLQWVEFLLATPAVLWAGWPLFVRGWQSVVNRSPNMFTLIALGVGVAWIYSVIGTFAPGLFPKTVQMEIGIVAVYFEAATVITALVLLGQVLELRARSRTSAAIKMLLGLAPKTARIVRADGREEDVALEQVKPGDRLRD